MSFKSGFITIVGRPNVGKSTLLNAIVGQKIAIMSPKAQTTRNTISGVYTTEEEQLVFIDTPGIHKPQHKLGEFMTDLAINTLNQVDVVLFMINGSEELGRGDQFIINELSKTKQPVILVVNQIDKINHEDVYNKITEYKDLYNFADVVPISAYKHKNIDTLIKVINSYLDEGPMFYPKDQVTDHPERFIITELIREKVLHLTEEEVPHSVAVILDKVEKVDSGVIEVMATIIVERAGQKGIIIGKGGKMLKEIGRRARRDIENLLGSKVYLETWVKVEKDWRNKQRYLNQLGYKNDEY